MTAHPADNPQGKCGSLAGARARVRSSLKLNVNEYLVLNLMVEEGCHEHESFVGFAFITSRIQLNRKQVRRACRSLARKGLTVYGRGLWNDDGEVAGSGYAATCAGVQFIEDHPR